MFASSKPFGQSSSSQFGSLVFGQTNSASNSPFAPGTFGSPNPFGSQTGSALFGGTPTGVFGQPPTPAFGASSSPAFGSSAPAFGASSTSAFGSSVFGQNSAFGGFGSSPSQTSQFGGGFQQTQSEFGSNPFGSTLVFGATSQPAFSATNTPAFGATSTPAFVNSSIPTFGTANGPVFGATTVPGFGSTSTPAFGSSTTAAFGTTSFGEATSTFGSTPFGSAPSPFGAQPASTFGASGQSGFGGQCRGSRVTSFTPTPETDGVTGTQPAAKLESISAMPTFKAKSHEELRWEDYQLGDKGGPNSVGQPAGGISFPTSQSNPFGSTGTFGQPVPLSPAAPSNPFALKTPTFGSSGSSGFSSSSSSIFNSPFGAPSSSTFGSTISTSSPFGGASVPGFGSSSAPSILGGTATPAFGSSSSLFGTSTAGSTSSFGSGLTFGNTQSSGLFQSSTPSFGQAPSPFGQPTTGFQQTMPAVGSNLFSMPSTGFGGSFFSSSSPSLLPTSSPMGFGQANSLVSSAFQPVASAQTSSGFSFGNFCHSQAAQSIAFGNTTNRLNQGILGQSSSVIQPYMVMQPTPVADPFGTLPTMPQISIGHAGSSPSIQYGISSMPVAEMPVPVRISSLVVPRYLFQRRMRLSIRKYHPKIEDPKDEDPFFADDETPSTPKDVLFIPRDNPRALVIRPIEQCPPRRNEERQSVLKENSTPANGHGGASGEHSAAAINGSPNLNHAESPSENAHIIGQDKATAMPSKPVHKANGVHYNHSQMKADSSSSTNSGHHASESAIAYQHGVDIKAMTPKLQYADYFTEPQIQELAAKERGKPGFCRQVKDLVVGRHGYGSIKFYGETDIRGLVLDSLIEFNNREVIVYKDESKKPPVGQGLNKPAEVTLLNIKFTNKKTGQQYTDGPKIERYKEMLRKKAEEKGAEFISYDAVKGEWIFRVKHFSRYEFIDGDPDVCLV
ncbi:hypothetical protein J5N97_008766 [Dioscorea zingiberensis]|uniref:Nucleoporin autopeptidase n=1 Tax=Dioscorea zingiberensis TaxID=325984 RepID=A0A9D5CVK4_9LILI|nr:hypothetical protein J5N97_008766 [Dioscorea zingiberensis]